MTVIKPILRLCYQAPYWEQSREVSVDLGDEKLRGEGGLGGPSFVQALTPNYLHRNHWFFCHPRLAKLESLGGPENLQFNKNASHHHLSSSTPVRIETCLCRGGSGCQTNLGLNLDPSRHLLPSLCLILLICTMGILVEPGAWGGCEMYMIQGRIQHSTWHKRNT